MSETAILTDLKTYTKMHVPFGDTKNEPYEVTRATARCSVCRRRVQLGIRQLPLKEGDPLNKWLHYWFHAADGPYTYRDNGKPAHKGLIAVEPEAKS